MAPSDPDHRLVIENLTVTLPSGRRILDRVCLEVAAGEIVVILGESGSGKSTLGYVLFDLVDDRMPEARVSTDRFVADERHMALILQQGSLFDHLSIADNIRFAAKRTRGDRLDPAQVQHILDQVVFCSDLKGVTGLSGGEERRLVLARGLATRPAFIFFDEPTAGLDPPKVRLIASLIRKVCREQSAGALVVTHDPLVAALVGDRLLYLDTDGTLAPLLTGWAGPVPEEDETALTERRREIERAVREKAKPERDSGLERRSRSLRRVLAKSLNRLADALTAPGRLLKDALSILLEAPKSLAHPADFVQIGWRALHLTGYSGLAFYALVGAILSTTFLSIAFAAANLVSPDLIVENLRGDFILALTPPLCGFLFSARSGSALTAWLGGMSLRGQTDALRSLGVSVTQYLRIPAFFGTFLGFLLSVVVFGAAMYLAASLTATGFGVAGAAETMRLTTSSFEIQFLEKTALYGAIVGVVGTHLGLTFKRDSHEVARGITRSIIICTLAIVLSELFFAVDLHA